MKYLGKIVKAKFINRENRFIAKVDIDGKIESVHVKNTGRCKEILIKDATVYLEESTNPNRKTKYSLVAVQKNDLLINIDSQAPNKVVYDGILNKKVKELEDIIILKKERTYGNSRFDLYYETKDKKGFIEIKGVTLENNSHCTFPDAPTTRGTKHVRELALAQQEGYINYIFFLIQFNGAKDFEANKEIDLEFSEMLLKSQKAGVKILCYDSIVDESGLVINKKIESKVF